jgi:hypothetical protein
LGLHSTRPHSDCEDALNQRSLTESALQTQGSAEVPGPTSAPILQETSDREFDARAREARRLAAVAPEDKQVLTSGNSSTSKRSGRGTGKYPSKRRRKRLSARQQKAHCEAHKREDELEAAKTEWDARGYPRIGWENLDARLQNFSPALCGILNGAIPSFYCSELASAAAERVNSKFRCMENATAGYYGPRGQRVM